MIMPLGFQGQGDDAHAVPMVELWRGDILESQHRGHAVICDKSGQVVEGWGDPNVVVLPRSSAKMIQALPLIESGAAAAAGLSSEHLALACASHNGAAIHTERVERWLGDLGLGEADLRCGPQDPDDRPEHERLIREGETPCQIHNNCSGKHAGFLTLSQHLGAGAEYVDPSHPVQMAAKQAFEEVTQETSPGYGIDGCSAPNFASTLTGMARAMAGFAVAREDGDARQRAQAQLVQAMMAHPELVAGEGRACTHLMRAMGGSGAVKTGAEAFFVGILPGKGLGIALKIEDGSTRAAEAVITALLVQLGVLDANDPTARAYIDAPLSNRRGIDVGTMRIAAALR